MEVRRPRCSLCGKEAIVTLPYARLRLCEEHLEQFLLKRTLRVQLPKKVLLGLSGGKDSVAALYLLKKAGIDVIAATVDTVPEYTEYEYEVARLISEEMGVEHYVIYAKELYGFTALSYKKTGRAPCSLCSLLRRHALETLARRLGISYVATGHNMDDMASMGLASFFKGTEDYKKVRPVEPPKGPARGRVRPLFWIPERDVLAFVLAKRLPWLKASCPLYEPRTTIQDYVKEFILRLEERSPGTRINLIKRLMSMASDEEGIPKACGLCGGPSWGEVCAVCKLRAKVGRSSETPMKPKVRTRGEGDVLVVFQRGYFWTSVARPRRVLDLLRALGLGPERAVVSIHGKPAPPESLVRGEPERGEVVVYVLPRIIPRLSS